MRLPALLALAALAACSTDDPAPGTPGAYPVLLPLSQILPAAPAPAPAPAASLAAEADALRAKAAALQSAGDG